MYKMSMFDKFNMPLCDRFCFSGNLSRQSQSPLDNVFKAKNDSNLKRKTPTSDSSAAAATAKMPKFADSEVGNNLQSQTNVMNCLPDLSRATSNYVQKLNQTVGQEFMKEGVSDNMRNFPLELSSNMLSESDQETSRTDIDMSIVKIEKQSESSEKENCKTGMNMNKFGMPQNLPQFAYPGVWNKGLHTSGSSQDLTNNSASLWNSFNPGQYSNDWQEPNTSNNMLPTRKEYKCDFCDKTFREKTNLRVHVRTHTGEKPFKCFLCGKEFAHSSNMKQHERGVHKLPPTVPQYKQQFYTGLSKMYEMTKQSENLFSENQMQFYPNSQNFQQNSVETKSTHTSADNEEEKEYLYKDAQVVFPTNCDNESVNRIKTEGKEIADSRDTSSQCMKDDSDSTAGSNEMENKTNGVDIL